MQRNDPGLLHRQTYKVRWLRDDEPTEEKLNFVYYRLKNARYDHQM